jgi:hypothetical protein
MENKEANDLIVSISNRVEVNKKTKSSKGRKRKNVDEFNEAVTQVIKEEVVTSKEEVVDPKEEVVDPKEEVVDPKEEVVTLKEEVVTPKEEEIVTSNEEEVVRSKEEEVISSKEEVITRLNDEEIVVSKEEHVKELIFVELLKQYITNKYLMDNIELKLDDRTKICLMFILQTYPYELYDIDKLVEVVIADGKIDINDLPFIIKFCGKVYELVKNTNMDYKTALDISCVILKFIIRVLVAEKKIKLDNTDTIHFIQCFDSLVDQCFSILKQNVVVQNGCISFVKNMLCKK